MSWLKNVNVLELSPAKHPATRKRKLHQKHASPTEDPMVTDQALQEYLEKSSLPEAVSKFIQNAIGALTKAKGDMPDDQFKSAQKALADLMGFGKKPEEVKKAEATIEEAKTKTAEIKAVVKSALEKLQGEKPATGDAINALADLVGVTPIIKHIEALPPEMKAQWEAMQKSATTNAQKLEEMQKSIDTQRDEAKAQEFITKAATTLPHVPGDAKDIGQLMAIVTKADAKAGEDLAKLLTSVNEIVEKSALLQDLGGSGHVSTGAHAVDEKISKMAKSYVEKSTDGLTYEQAYARVLDENPKLFDEYNKSRAA